MDTFYIQNMSMKHEELSFVDTFLCNFVSIKWFFTKFCVSCLVVSSLAVYIIIYSKLPCKPSRFQHRRVQRL